MDELKECIAALLKSGALTFKGARKRHNLAPGATGILYAEGRKWAQETGEPVAAAITKACAAYWELFEERGKK